MSNLPRISYNKLSAVLGASSFTGTIAGLFILIGPFSSFSISGSIIGSTSLVAGLVGIIVSAATVI